MEDAFGIGDKLAKLRRENKYTLDEVADGIGIARSTYYDYEQGNVVPKLDFIQKAAVFYKVDPLVFFTGTNYNISQQHNQVANGYIHNQQNTDPEVFNKMLTHIDERTKRLDDIMSKALDILNRMKGPILPDTGR